MPSKIRLFLEHDQQRRDFYWFEAGSDGSIYFGSSVKSFTRSAMGLDVHVPADGPGARLDYSMVVPSELRGKHSIHQSGVVLGPHVGERRRRRAIPTLSGNPRAIPLVGIAPLDPDQYPTTEKSPRPGDVSFDTTVFGGEPFAILSLALPLGVTEPQLGRLWDRHIRVARRIRSYDLVLLFYRIERTFKAWPKSQHEVVAHRISDRDLAYPTFADLPRPAP